MCLLTVIVLSLRKLSTKIVFSQHTTKLWLTNRFTSGHKNNLSWRNMKKKIPSFLDLKYNFLQGGRIVGTWYHSFTSQEFCTKLTCVKSYKCIYALFLFSKWTPCLVYISMFFLLHSCTALVQLHCTALFWLDS